jgi:DNA-binding transcriptional regulator YhcF (GntR family)
VSKVDFRSWGGHAEHDASIDLHLPGRQLTLLVDVKSEIFPQQARELIARRNGEPHVVVIADRISAGARELLLGSGTGTFSVDGRLHLPFVEFYIVIDHDAAPVPHVRRPSRFKLFSPARIPVLHALLLAPDRWCSVNELSTAAGVSTASVSKLLAHLEKDEWIETKGGGPTKVRKLEKAATLLDAWVAHEQSHLTDRRIRRFFLSGRKGEDLLHFVRDALTDEAGRNEEGAYAITGEAAAQIYAPYLTQWSAATIRATPSALERLIKQSGIREVQQGANLLVVEVEPSGLRFAQWRDEVLLASPVQTYVDLMVASGRAPDAGRFLREQVLGF